MPLTGRFILLAVLLALAAPAQAKPDPGRPLAVPYFASLKRSEANVRVGPGRGYPIRWVYKQRGLPVEVLAVFGNWRHIRTSDGGEGWISGVLLSPRRTALVDPWSEEPILLRSSAREEGSIAARLQPRVLVGLRWCDRVWCAVRLSGSDRSGYVKQTRLWGVYPDEEIRDQSVWSVIRKLL
ncbi:SH3 domain-containing protein [Microvirga puerhi]|uniref:SH3b domain-containing protein n=1 Tax=Microvirga puerhi TaxID=2876078 RepID=A0ABS7VQS2_9HYPH|nr:SH3 domain-containing protein [Microvirga puerhi]MBZ6077879.1 hypothetical protein [Microvirga puerhi]